MQITVKSTKSLKSGSNKNGEWELIGVTSDDGTNYTTFHKGAKHLTAGAVIEFDPEIKEGKLSFKEYKVISEGTAPAANGDRHGMTPENWAEKDRLERWSRECNTCFMGIMELAAKHETPNHISGKFGEVFDSALDWALAHFKPTPKTETTPKPTQTKTSGTAISDPTFHNYGEFYTACLKQFKLSKSKVDTEIAGIDLSTEKGRATAWATIKAIYGGKDEKDPAETKDAIEPEDIKWD